MLRCLHCKTAILDLALAGSPCPHCGQTLPDAPPSEEKPTFTPEMTIDFGVAGPRNDPGATLDSFLEGGSLAEGGEFLEGSAFIEGNSFVPGGIEHEPTAAPEAGSVRFDDGVPLEDSLSIEADAPSQLSAAPDAPAEIEQAGGSDDSIFDFDTDSGTVEFAEEGLDLGGSVDLGGEATVDLPPALASPASPPPGPASAYDVTLDSNQMSDFLRAADAPPQPPSLRDTTDPEPVLDLAEIVAEDEASPSAGTVGPDATAFFEPPTTVPRVGGVLPLGDSDSSPPAGGDSPGKLTATPDMTAIFQPPVDRKAATRLPAVTQVAGAQESPRSVLVATRKLSAKDMELMTNTWGSGISEDAHERSSLKLESKGGQSGARSSLVVNPRGLRNVQDSAPLPTTGADYELLEVIGKGGMGVVYAARQASVDRMVAVKMIRPHVAADMQRRATFLTEAVVTGDLDHPNIVPIYELGTNEQNALFYSMKRVQGTPWSDVIQVRSLNENLEILMKVADAIAFAHANGVVHRDLKPENVMLGDFGEVLVMDWGLALATETFRHSEFVTRPESMGGTPAYMAPEMATGPFELIGPASDIYLLGGLLFEVVTGLRPHTGTTAQECLYNAARNVIQDTSESGELIDVAYKAMATDPAQRFGSVQEFQSAIRDYHSHCESTALAARADQELTQAGKTGDYQSFAHALFGFQEALKMWDGNTRARAGISEARLAYAEGARTRGDYELGISLLDSDNESHAPLLNALNQEKRDLESRKKWLSRFKRIAAALVIVVFGVVSIALVMVNDAKNQAVDARNAAEMARKAAEDAKEQEAQQRELAEKAEKRAKSGEKAAREAESAALTAEAAAKAAQESERKQKDEAIAARTAAQAAEKRAVAAKQGEEYAAYVARVGMAAAKVDENAFDTADSLLAASVHKPGEPNLRNWEWGHLKRLSTQGSNFAASGVVNSVAFAPDGKWFVTAGEDGQAHLWNQASGKQRLAVKHGGVVYATAVSPDGKLVATGGGDGQVRIANAADGKAIATLKGHRSRVTSVAFSPRDGRYLLTASRDRTARLWDVKSGQEIKGSPLQGHSWWVGSAAFSPDERQIVTAGQDGKVIVWSADLAAGRVMPQVEFLGHQGPVFVAAFSADGQVVASAGHDRRVLVWQPAKIKNVELKQLVANQPVEPQDSRSFEGHSAPIRSLAFSKDGQYLLSAGDDNTVRIWELLTGRLHALLRGHSRPVQSCAISPDGRQVVSGAQQGEIKLWNLVDYREVRALASRVLEGHDDALLSAGFSRDGKQIVTASQDHTASVYDAASGQRLHWLREGHDFLASRAAFFDSGRRLVTAAGDNSVRIWDAATGAQLSMLEGTGRTAAVAVSQDGRLLLTGKIDLSGSTPNTAAEVKTQDGKTPSIDVARIALWDLDPAGGAPRPHAFAQPNFGLGHTAAVSAVAISYDGRWLYSGDESGVGKLWDASTGQEVRTLSGHTREITDALFLPNSKRLLTASNDGTVAQWDVATGRELPIVLSHADATRSDAADVHVRGMALSNDGRQLLTVAEEVRGTNRQCLVRLWNVDSGNMLRELYRGDDDLTSVAFAEGDRQALAVRQPRASGARAGSGAAVRGWNLDNGREVLADNGQAMLEFKSGRESIWAAIAAPDGAGVLTIGGNGASLWDPLEPARPTLVFKPHGSVTSAGFSGDGQRIVTGGSDYRVKIWNAATGLADVQLPQEHRRPITSASFSPVDDKLVVTASSDGTARIWDVAARKLRSVLDHPRTGGAAPAVRAAVFSPNGKFVLTASDDGAARVWNAATGKIVRELKLGTQALAVAYSQDGARIIAGGADGRAVLFDAESGKPLVRYLGHTDEIRSVALSPDGMRALTGSADRSAKLWDTDRSAAAAAGAKKPSRGAGNADEAKDGKEILTLKHHDQVVTSVAFSPDGQSVLTAGLDGTAVVWLADSWADPAEK